MGLKQFKWITFPEKKWESADSNKIVSLRDETRVPVNQSRDPFIFQDQDSALYLLYTTSGEQGIAITKLGVK